MKRNFLFLSLIVLAILFIGCGTRNKMQSGESEPGNKVPDPKGSTENSFVVSGPVAEKKRVIKGEVQEETDYFLERSVQDYFIKFCESKVTRAEFESYLKKQKSTIKTIKADIEYREGEWDSCDEPGKAASRTGAYVIILSLIE
jgi:hypothetical protein